MLKLMRQGASSAVVKYVVFGLLMAGALGLALSSGYSFNAGGAGGKNTIAVVGGTKLDARTFEQIVNRTLAQQSIDRHEAYQKGYIDQILAAQIDNILLEKATQDLGLTISDDMVTEQIKHLLEPFKSSGMSAKDALKTILRNQGMSEAMLMQEVRSEMAKTLLRNALQIGTAVPSEDEVKDVAVFGKEKRAIEYVFLPDSSVKDYKTPADDVLKPFYEAGQERYAIPETRSFTVAFLSDKSSSAAAIPDDELRKLYEEQKSSFSLPERRRLDQAVLDNEDKAKKVAAEIGKGKSLKESVKTVTGDVKAYSGAQLYQQDGLDKNLGHAAFTAKQGEIAGPVQTPLGWHVMVVDEIKPPSVQPFDEVKDQLRKDAQADRAGEALYNTSMQLDDALAGGAGIEDVAKTFNLQTAKIGPVHRDGSTPDKHDGMKDYAKDSAAILTAAFNLSEGETSSVISLADGRYAAIHLDALKPKTYQPFDDVKQGLAKLWIADQQSVLNKERASGLLEKVKAGQKTLDVVAKDNGGFLNTAEIERFAAVSSPLTQDSKAGFFVADKDSYVLLPAKDGIVIGKVKSIALPSAPSAEDLKKISAASLQGTQNEIMDVYLAELRRKYKVQINQDRLTALYQADVSAGLPDNAGGDQ